MSQKNPRLPIVLAAAGFLLSIGLEIEHVRAHLHPAASSYCAIDDHFDCVKVALSPLSRILDIPLPIWGAAGFLAIGISACRHSIFFLLFSAFSTLASIALLIEEVVFIKSVCVLCETVHLICFALFIIAYYQYKKDTLRIDLDRYFFLSEIGIPSGIVVLSYLFVPPYWALVSWNNKLNIPRGVDDAGHSWIGAVNPKVTIHEYTDYSCPHCALAASRSRMRLMKYRDTLRLVRHQQPRISCSKIARTSCQYVRAAMCAGEQDKFWQMDDWLFRYAPGRATVDFQRAALDVGLDYEKLSRCMERDDVYKKADEEAKAARRKRILYTPMYYVGDKRLTSVELEQELEKYLGR
jgi:uncharacterized membrane protein